VVGWKPAFDNLAHMPKESQIVAMGGGGFSMEPDNLALDKYVLSLSGVVRPKVSFLATASGDSDSYVERFYTSFRSLPCEPTHLSLFRPHPGDLRSYVLGQDVIYVGGGSTRNLLVLWREWGLDIILKEAWTAGVVLAGISAGSICWFQEGVTDSVEAARLHAIQCLGFLPGSNCPHYDGESERRPAYHRLLREAKLQPGYAADDGAGLHFIGQRLAHCVTSRSTARAYRVELAGTEIRETAIESTLLAPSR
jgi:dipeptidase E